MVDDFVVLHMSDLHFGNKYRFGSHNAKSMGNKFGDAIRLKLDSKSLKVGLIIVSGDFAETGIPEEFKNAQCFLDAMCEKLGLSPKTIVGVPGNHDIARPDCQSVRNKLKMGEIEMALLESSIQEEKLKRYDSFMRDNDIAGIRTVLGDMTKTSIFNRCFVYDFYEAKIAIAALNSVEREDDEIHGGFVSEDQIQAFMNEFSSARYDSYFKIAVVHHNPTVTTDRNLEYNRDYLGTVEQLNKGEIDQYIVEWTGFEGRDMFQRLMQNRHFNLVLHGHQHDYQDHTWRWGGHEDGSGYVFSAGSLGLIDGNLPKAVPLSCNVFHMKFRNGNSKMNRMFFQYDGSFSTVNDVTDGNLVHNSDRDLVRTIHVGEGFFEDSNPGSDNSDLPRMIIIHDDSDGTNKVISEMKYYTKPLSGKILSEYWDINTIDSKISNEKYLDGVKWVIILMNRKFYSSAEGNVYCKDMFYEALERNVNVVVLELYESLFNKIGLNGIPYDEMRVFKCAKPFEGMVEAERTEFFNNVFFEIFESLE